MTVTRLKFESPYGCRWCGVQQRHHGRRYRLPVGMHAWEAPWQQTILMRMRRRRTARLNTEPAKYHATTGWAADESGESGEPYCADCQTDGCRQWIRNQTRLGSRRMELDGINPKRRSKTAGGWGDSPPW